MPLSCLSNDLRSSLWRCVAVFVLGSRCVGSFAVRFSRIHAEVSNKYLGRATIVRNINSWWYKVSLALDVGNRQQEPGQRERCRIK